MIFSLNFILAKTYLNYIYPISIKQLYVISKKLLVLVTGKMLFNPELIYRGQINSEL